MSCTSDDWRSSSPALPPVGLRPARLTVLACLAIAWASLTGVLPRAFGLPLAFLFGFFFKGIVKPDFERWRGSHPEALASNWISVLLGLVGLAAFLVLFVIVAMVRRLFFSH